jgi:hypothetical protein
MTFLVTFHKSRTSAARCKAFYEVIPEDFFVGIPKLV